MVAGFFGEYLVVAGFFGEYLVVAEFFGGMFSGGWVFWGNV